MSTQSLTKSLNSDDNLKTRFLKWLVDSKYGLPSQSTQTVEYNWIYECLMQHWTPGCNLREYNHGFWGDTWDSGILNEVEEFDIQEEYQRWLENYNKASQYN